MSFLLVKCCSKFSLSLAQMRVLSGSTSSGQFREGGGATETRAAMVTLAAAAAAQAPGTSLLARTRVVRVSQNALQTILPFFNLTGLSMLFLYSSLANGWWRLVACGQWRRESGNG